MGRRGRARRASGQELERWEQKLIEAVARSIRTTDRDDLEAELAQRLFVLKRQSRSAIKNWRAYVFKFLRNKAFSWIRRWRSLQERMAPLDRSSHDPGEEGRSLADTLALSEPEPAESLALAQFLEHLDLELKRIWEALVEARGNRTKAARRLGLHRNTIGARVREIQQLLIAHGFGAGAQAISSMTTPRAPVREAEPKVPTKRERFIQFSSPLLKTLLTRRLSGTQWRILLWVIRETSRHKQRATSFSWSRIARDLSIHRSNAFRAGMNLQRADLLSVHGGKIGLPRRFGRLSKRRH
jgi:DNA-directed RNA polymerase specialized sigma24 family protein